MPKRLTKTKKLLRLFEGIVLETGALMYPYKGVGKGWRRYRGELSRAIYDMTTQGYLEPIENSAKKAYRLTKKGRLHIWNPKIDKIWDGGWRIVMFDISDNKTRNSFRSNLKIIGFKLFQDSVWVCPYDVSSEIEELIDLLEINDKVDYLVTKTVTNDSVLRGMFDL